MLRALLALISAVLLLPALAAGGGFATVQLDSLPAGTNAGGTWTPTLTVLAHGRTPIDGIVPTIRISNGSDAREFTALPTGETGKYRAAVEFPAAGTWRYEIWDGYTQTHTYPPVAIGPAGGGVTGDGFPWLWLATALAGSALAAAVLVPLARRRGGVTRPAPTG